MRSLRGLKVIPVIMLALLFAGCATTKPAVKVALPEAKKISIEKYTNKVDNFMVLMDASSSMAYSHKNQVKYDIAKNIAEYMNQTMPDMKINGAMKTFGHAPEVTSNNVMTTYAQAPYTKAALKAGIGKVKSAGGLSPLSDAIEASYEEIKSYKGTTSVIIISDGEEMTIGSTNEALDKLKKLGTVCVYTIHVGDSSEGTKFFKEITTNYGCGFVANADELASPDKMELFVKKVFLKDKAPVAATAVAPAVVEGDRDGDGVKDKKDECPDTPKGAKVNAKGCWVLGDLLFDTGKADLKPAGIADLDKVVIILKGNPDLKVEVQGHTDNAGSKESNQKLSEKRANAVMDYLVKKGGVEASRLTAKGYGLTKPAASNKTAAGKAQNRRVQLNPVRR